MPASNQPQAVETFRPVDVARYNELCLVEVSGRTLTARRGSGTVTIDLRKASLTGDPSDFRVWSPGAELRFVAADWSDAGRLLSLVRTGTPRSRVALRDEPDRDGHPTELAPAPSGQSVLERSRARRTVATAAIVVGVLLVVGVIVLATLGLIPEQWMRMLIGLGGGAVAIAAKWLIARGKGVQ